MSQAKLAVVTGGSSGIGLEIAMEETKVGASKKKVDPADVAKAGWEAMKKGDPAVVPGLKNKLEVAAADMMTEAATAKLHRAQAQPGSASE